MGSTLVPESVFVRIVLVSICVLVSPVLADLPKTTAADGLTTKVTSRENKKPTELTTVTGLNDTSGSTEAAVVTGETDNVGLSTVIVELKHYGTRKFTFLEPDHIPISNFLDLDENVDLELLFTEQVQANNSSQNSSPAENIVLQIEDYDDEGNTKSYFLHSSPYSENPANDTVTTSTVSSRVSGFFRDILQRLGVYKYIVSYRNRQKDGAGALAPNLPHRFHPNFVNTPKGLRNLALSPVEEDQVTTSVPPSSSTTGKQRPSKGPPVPPPPPKSSIGSLFDQFKQRIKAIYPGTVWCGDGNQAKSENDIGFFYQTDVCCRAHDLCPLSIAAGEQFNRLRNNGYFTRSHCDCDKQFYNCLKNANSLVSNQIGYTYFNLLKPQCFRHEHPKVACSKKSKGRCLTYVVDETQEKLWQWFDNLIY
ncbi:uncharacterized protein LOC128732455 [Sabethes cyaneus]|uniref:uncharacterized protein LOC128732455 n=1 Tax=Sabethes cyaneus TaxID=53552 RepID=UPI00237E59CF|nr:uncharacterized protein LOC128732455 [Sabethes cyaneus]